MALEIGLYSKLAIDSIVWKFQKLWIHESSPVWELEDKFWKIWTHAYYKLCKIISNILRLFERVDN